MKYRLAIWIRGHNSPFFSPPENIKEAYARANELRADIAAGVFMAKVSEGFFLQTSEVLVIHVDSVEDDN